MSDENVQVLPEKIQANKLRLKPDAWMVTINFIKRLVLDNNIMMAILAEQGNGKTTFASLLHAELEPYMKPHLITAGPLFNRAFFLQQLKELLGVNGEAIIANFITSINERKAHVLLIIDDAHFLSPVFIEELLGEMQLQDNMGFFHVCLLSDFSLVPTLNKLGEERYQDKVHSIELGTLSEKETKLYLLQHLLPRQNIEKRVTDERVKQFYQLTAGHLVDINRQMKSFFNGKIMSSKKKLLSPANVAVAMLAIMAAYVWYTPHSRAISPERVVQTAQNEEVENQRLASEIEPILYSYIPAYEIAAVRQAILPTPLRKSDLLAINEDDDEATSDDSLVILDRVIVAPKIVHPQEKPTALIKTSPATPAKIESKLIKSPKALQSIVSQSNYTIQLLASHNKKKLQYFVQAHGLQGKVQLRRSKRGGVEWYVLTFGEYKRRQNAINAFSQLPKEVTQYKPWVRALSEFKQLG